MMDAVILFSFFLVVAVPLTGFVTLGWYRQREQLRWDQEAHKQAWKRAGRKTYTSYYTEPPKRLF